MPLIVKSDRTDVNTEIPGDYYTEVALGNVLGRSILSGMGVRESMGITATGEDLWPGNELSSVPSAPASHTDIPTPGDAGEQMSIISESTNDAAAGTGARTVDIHYLDATGNDQEVEVTMNGTTAVNLPISDVRFIQYIHTATKGSGNVAAGNIRIYKTSDSTLVYSMIKAGGNVSLVPHRMVPYQKTLVIKSWHTEEAQAKRCAFRLLSTNHGLDAYPGVFQFQDHCYLKQTASGELKVNILVPALSIVKVTAWPDATGAEGSCHWWGELVDD